MRDSDRREEEPGNRRALSPREKETLRYIADGLTHAQVARRMRVSVHTVDTYLRRIRGKYNIGNKAELTRLALASGSADHDRGDADPDGGTQRAGAAPVTLSPRPALRP